MSLIQIVITGFILLEASNVAALYFFPDSKLANSVGVFKAWERSKADPELHDLVRYLVNWVSGAKLIFISLLVVILMTVEDETISLVGVALNVSISSFFWRLFPLIKRMDHEGQIEPKGYSKVLGVLIMAFVLVFLLAVLFTRT